MHVHARVRVRVRVRSIGPLRRVFGQHRPSIMNLMHHVSMYWLLNLYLMHLMVWLRTHNMINHVVVVM